MVGGFLGREVERTGGSRVEGHLRVVDAVGFGDDEDGVRVACVCYSVRCLRLVETLGEILCRFDNACFS